MTGQTAIKEVLGERWKQARVVLISNDPIRYVLVGLRDDGTIWRTMFSLTPDISKMTCSEILNWVEVKLLNAALGLNQYVDSPSPYYEHPVNDEEFEAMIRSTDGIEILNSKVDGALRLVLNGA